MHPPIYTIGHGTRSLPVFLDLLEKCPVDFLIDVRSVPFSAYNPQYNRSTLSEALKTRNIQYLYMGNSLGGRPSDPTCYRDGRIDYDLVQEKDFFIAGLQRLITAHEKQVRLALMCSESQPQHCHRSRLIGRALAQRNIPVRHIDEKGQLRDQAIVHPSLF